MEKNRSIKEIQYLFKELWPQTFTELPQPLKIGIDKDILNSGLPAERPFSAREVKKGLHGYTTKIRYKKKALQAAGRARIDLDGQPAGEVSPEDAQSARDIVSAKEQANKKKKKEKKQAKSEAAAALLAAKVAKKEQEQQAAAALVSNEAKEVQQPKQVNVQYRRRRKIDQSKLG